jgi:hypothetical protein
VVARPQKRTEGAGEREERWAGHFEVSFSTNSFTGVEEDEEGGLRRARISMLEKAVGVVRMVERMYDPCDDGHGCQTIFRDRLW